MSRGVTGSQTVGPYFAVGTTWLHTDDLTTEAAEGERITVTGRVVDGDGAPIPDAFLEIWQANTHGRYAHPEDRQNKPVDANFKGFGRVPTDRQGVYRFRTIRPGPVPSPAGAPQASHLNVTLFMRGQLMHLYTRIYFDDDPAVATDPVLAQVEPGRRRTLIARRQPGREAIYALDIFMQGPDETVFFDI